MNARFSYSTGQFTIGRLIDCMVSTPQASHIPAFTVGLIIQRLSPFRLLAWLRILSTFHIVWALSAYANTTNIISKIQLMSYKERKDNLHLCN